MDIKVEHHEKGSVYEGHDANEAAAAYNNCDVTGYEIQPLGLDDFGDIIPVDLSQKASKWGVYLRREDGLAEWVADTTDKENAILLMDSFSRLSKTVTDKTPTPENFNGKFPNGISCYLETHYVIVVRFTLDRSGQLQQQSSKLDEIQEQQGTGGIWEYAEELTDKFEKTYTGREWDGDWLDTIDKFLDDHL